MIIRSACRRRFKREKRKNKFSLISKNIAVIAGWEWVPGTGNGIALYSIHNSIYIDNSVKSFIDKIYVEGGKHKIHYKVIDNKNNNISPMANCLIVFKDYNSLVKFKMLE